MGFLKTAILTPKKIAKKTAEKVCLKCNKFQKIELFTIFGQFSG